MTLHEENAREFGFTPRRRSRTESGMNKVKGLLIGAGVGVLSAFGITGALVAFGEWTAYASEYTHAGLKFAGETDPGCGLELPTELGRDADLTVFYCEYGNGWSFIPEYWYTTYYMED